VLDSSPEATGAIGIITPWGQGEYVTGIGFNV
jgi:hypothetical protein